MRAEINVDKKIHDMSDQQQLDKEWLSHFRPVSSQTRVIYLAIFFLLAAIIGVLPLLKVNISVRARGIIRPSSERAAVRSPVSGIIKEAKLNEGLFVKKEELIVIMEDSSLVHKSQWTDREINNRKQLLHDLALIDHAGRNPLRIREDLLSAVMASQWRQHTSAREEWLSELKKIGRQLALYEQLGRDSIIALQELFEKRVDYEKAVSSLESFENAQRNKWVELSAQYKSELGQLLEQRQQLKEEEKSYRIRAPAAGYLQNTGDKYPGSMVSQGELLAMITPETELIAECWIGTADIGLLYTGQRSRFRIDAFNYNYFGALEGKIIAVDHDFTMIGNRPMFKVRCSFNKPYFPTIKGFTARLKKGMELDALFITAQRSLWQLCFDRVNDWLNPAAGR